MAGGGWELPWVWGAEANAETSPGSPPSVWDTCIWAHPGPSVILPQALGSEGTIPGRAHWSRELSKALIHDLIPRKAITQSPVLFLAAKCK